MIFTKQRLYHTKTNPKGNYTLGFLTNDVKSFRSFLLEDTHHDVKVPGDTRIAAGFYELKLRAESTPLTIKHREAYKAYPFFKANPGWFHIEITGIKNFNGVYFHSGIDDAHTLGCNLPCYAFDITKQDKPGASSLQAVNDFYAIVYPILKAGKKVFLEVKDEIPTLNK
jgi:hypothetical protein